MPLVAIRGMRKKRRGKDLKLTNTLEFSGLEKHLKEAPMLEEEKAMWRHLGFCISGPDHHVNAEGKRVSGNYCYIIDHTGNRDSLNANIGYNMKNMFLISWQEGSATRHAGEEDGLDDLQESLQKRRMG